MHGVLRAVLAGVRGVHDVGARPVHMMRAGGGALPHVLAGVLGAGHHVLVLGV